MSFILDALGKADDDRRRAAVPELRTPAQKPASPARRVVKGLMLLGLVLASFALGYYARPYIENGYSVSIVRGGPERAVKTDADLRVSDNAGRGGEVTMIEPELAGASARPSNGPLDDMAEWEAIELAVISFSRVPAERFAMLNGFVMYEGDILPGGEQLLEIGPDSVLLEKEGEQYNLSMAMGPRP